MINRIFVVIVVFAFLTSCSSDKNDGPAEEEITMNALVGTWDATELVVNNNTASDDALYAKQILDYLTNRGCVILTLQFNEDLSASASNAADYVDIRVTGTGFDIPCPTESDVQESTYTFDGNVVTILDTNGETVTVEVSISGDVMTVDAADLEIPNLTDGGELIFTRR